MRLSFLNLAGVSYIWGMEEKIVSLILIRHVFHAIGFVPLSVACDVERRVLPHISDHGDEFVIIGENINKRSEFHTLDENFEFYPSSFRDLNYLRMSIRTAAYVENKGKVLYKSGRTWLDPLEAAVRFFGDRILDGWHPQWETF